MFIRVVKKQRSKDSKVYYQFNLVQASRMGSQVKQRVILYLGSSPLLEDKENRVQVLSILKSKIFDQPDLFPTDCDAQLKQLGLNLYEKYKIRYNIESESTDNQNVNTENVVSIPPLPELADYHQVDIKGLEIAEVKAFNCKSIIQPVKKYVVYH